MNLSVFFDFLEKNYGIFAEKIEPISTRNELVFFVQSVDNQCFTLKVYRSSGAPSSEKLAEIGFFLQKLKKHKTAVANPIFSIKKELVTTVFFDKKYLPVCVFEWLDGDNRAADSMIFAEKSGQILQKIHAISEKFGSKNPEFLTDLNEIFVLNHLEFLPKILQKFGLSGNENEDFKQKIVDFARISADWRREFPEDFGTIHSDFHARNILFKNSKIVGVIDWDEAAFGPFLLDIAVVFADFDKFSSEKSAVLKSVFLKNYEKNGRKVDFEKLKTARKWADFLYLSWVFHPKNTFLGKEPTVLNAGIDAFRRFFGTSMV